MILKEAKLFPVGEDGASDPIMPLPEARREATSLFKIYILLLWTNPLLPAGAYIIRAPDLRTLRCILIHFNNNISDLCSQSVQRNLLSLKMSVWLTQFECSNDNLNNPFYIIIIKIIIIIIIIQLKLN